MRNETTDCLRNRRALTTEDEDDGAPSTKPISGGDLKDPVVLGPMRQTGLLPI